MVELPVRTLRTTELPEIMLSFRVTPPCKAVLATILFCVTESAKFDSLMFCVFWSARDENHELRWNATHRGERTVRESQRSTRVR